MRELNEIIVDREDFLERYNLLITQENELKLYFENRINSPEKQKEYDELIKQNDSGKLYECMIQRLFNIYGFGFSKQEHINKIESFKKTEYGFDVDGLLEGAVYYDIKKLGMGEDLFSNYERKLENEWRKITSNPDLHVFITDHETWSVDAISSLINKHKDEVKNTINNEMHKHINGEYEIFIPYNENNENKQLIVKIIDRSIDKKTQLVIQHSSFDKYLFAELNQYHCLKHASQICKTKPFIFIYCYDKGMQISFSDDEAKDVFRTLARRIFIGLKNDTTMIEDHDKKAISGIQVQEAIQYLSGIWYVNIDDPSDISNSYLFINPNAKNKIPKWIVNQKFSTHQVYVDDFMHDNY